MRLMAAAACLGISIAAAGAQPAPLSRAAVEADFTRLDCFVDLDEALRNQQSFDLGGGKRLVLVLCLQGAYQGSSIAYAIDGDAPPRLLDFPEWERGRLVPSAFVTEAAFDPATKEMTAFAKGRGLGDCGSLGTWRWNGTAFTLKTFFNKEKCDGRLFEARNAGAYFRRGKRNDIAGAPIRQPGDNAF